MSLTYNVSCQPSIENEKTESKKTLRAINKTSREPVNNERTTVFLGSLAVSTHAEEKNHRGTEKGCDLCLRALCASVVQPSSQNRGSVRRSNLKHELRTSANFEVLRSLDNSRRLHPRCSEQVAVGRQTGQPGAILDISDADGGREQTIRCGAISGVA